MSATAKGARFVLVGTALAMGIVDESPVRADSACRAPGPLEAAFYEHENEGGACVVVRLGDVADVTRLGLPNNEISSVIVGEGVRALLYDSKGFHGDQAKCQQCHRSPLPQHQRQAGQRAQARS